MIGSGVIAMMTVSIVGVLIVAALFFVVTMALAVGPLLLCRIFAGTGGDECRPRPRRSSLASGVLTFCGVVIGLAAGLFVLRFALSSPADRPTHATVVHADTGIAVSPPFAPNVPPGAPQFSLPGEPPLPQLPIEVAEHSLFAPPQFPPPPPTPVMASYRAHFEIAWVVLMPLLLFTLAIVVLGSERLRNGLVRALPALLAVALLAALFFWTSDVSTTPQYVDRPAPAVQYMDTMGTVHTAAEAPIPVASPPRRPLVTSAELEGPASEPMPEVAEARAVDPAPAGPPTTTQQADAEVTAEKADPPVVAYVGTAAAGVPRDALPQWVHQSAEDDPIRVINSGLHATVQLAEEHALEELKTLLQTEMVRRYPQAAGWQPSDQAVVDAGNILQRAVERTQIQVGENTIPMYEAYWQVDLGRLEPLYRAWRPSIVRQRLLQIGGAIALVMLLLASIAGVLRVDEQTHGRRRKSLAAGTLALWAVIGSGLALFVA